MTRLYEPFDVHVPRALTRVDYFAAPVADASHIVGAPAPEPPSRDTATQDEAGAANHQ